MQSSNPKVVSIIAAYNEEMFVGDVVRRTLSYSDAVIVIDDGSQDDTALRSAKAGAYVIANGRNRGKGYALRRGIMQGMEMNADIIVTLDADSQHLPEEIPRLVAPLLDGRADLTIGTRFPYRYKYSVRAPSIRWASNRLSTFLVRFAAGLKASELSDSQCGFRGFSRKALSCLNLVSERYNIEGETVIQAARLGLRIAEVPIACIYSARLRSKMKPSREIPLFLMLILRSLFDRWRHHSQYGRAITHI